MADLFVDTSGCGNVFVKEEPYFAEATKLSQERIERGSKLITTNLVLAELSALLTSPLRIPRIQQIPIIENIRQSPWANIVHIDPHLDSAAFDLFCQRADKL